MLPIIEKATINSLKKKKNIKDWLKIVLKFSIFFIIIILLIVWRVQTKYGSQILNIEELSFQETALVFGAGLSARDWPSPILSERILTAIELYQQGKVNNFLMSGDNVSENHNEVEAMKNYAMSEGILEKNILVDNQGLSTYESCQQAKEKFNLTKVVLVTQRQHLRRALYDCNELGLKAVGVSADKNKFTFREWGASLVDWFKINF